jgi:hypothetical protein
VKLGIGHEGRPVLVETEGSRGLGGATARTWECWGMSWHLDKVTDVGLSRG